MEKNFWECEKHKFIPIVSKKYDKNGKAIKNKYDLKFIFGCNQIPAPLGSINLCRLPLGNKVEFKGNCPLL